MTVDKIFNLVVDPFGRLVLTTSEGRQYTGVRAVRAFPIQAPEEGIALICVDGKEVAWIATLAEVDVPTRMLIQDNLAESEFMPEISAITHVTSYATPSTWNVNTDRGETSFVLRGEEDIRRIGQNMLLIGDVHGIHYLIRDLAALDKSSRKILDRFL